MKSNEAKHIDMKNYADREGSHPATPILDNSLRDLYILFAEGLSGIVCI